MPHAVLEPPPAPKRAAVAAPSATRPAPMPTVRFESLVLTQPASLAKGRSATLTLSLLVHAALIAALVLIPLFYDDFLPAPDERVFRTFFVTPVVMAPPPPPPPPPAAGVRAQPRTPAAPRPPEEPARFVAPIETPTEIQPEETLDLGVEGGVPGGVEGGVPGGVVGGVVGGLPTEAPPPQKAVRLGGKLKPPALLHRVEPRYPPLALEARVAALLILEATVGADGHVQEVTVLRGQPLFDDAAVAAVKQWRYRPLLLNGVPTPFILTVTLKFSVSGAVVK